LRKPKFRITNPNKIAMTPMIEKAFFIFRYY
jgi:hypothetical protein